MTAKEVPQGKKSKPHAQKFSAGGGKVAYKDGAVKRFDGTKQKQGGNNKFHGKPYQGKKEQQQQQAGGEGEKKDWAKFKQEKKDLKLKRKSSRDTYEITKEAKQIYEKLRCRRTEKKDQLVAQIYKLLNVGDTISKIAKAHDTARVLQCMLKYAAPPLRAELSDKLLPHVIEMCQSKYAQFCVKRMLKYGAPATKSKLVDSLMGNIVRLAGHNIASSLLDSLYLNVSTPQQRNFMRQEFYGELYKKAKDANVKTLEDTYKEASNLKASIMGAVKANLDHVANKKLVDSSLVHAVMLEYVRACDEEKLEETVTAFAALVPHMLSTKDGSEAAIICFYKSTPKNRRAIIKNIKEHLLKIATHEHGHVFLIAVLNSLDDTKATKKAIYDHLHADLKTLVASPYGRRVIQWLVAPGDTSCFHPGFIKTIEEGLAYGKKDKEARRKEIFEQIEAPIADAIAEDAAFWLSNSHIGLVTADILNYITTENYERAIGALVQVVANPDWRVSALPADGGDAQKKKQPQDVEAVIAEATKQRKKLLNVQSEESSDEDNSSDEQSEQDEDETAKLPKKSKKEQQQKKDEKKDQTTVPSVAGIEDAGMHHVLKKIIKNDSKRENGAASFGAQLLKQLSTDVLKQWLSVNRGCFVLVKLVEDSADLLKSYKAVIDVAELRKLLIDQKTPGAKLLASKLGFVKK
ncbi:protein penguin [Scaptodrosophila lebanonensis]|uniref:Protein penguin n=1 Tax=Drosophila lebanonensis TaxID=7225 RepID=A0A6J2U0T9_DROLE|nr:protein penguin [Scaptodrosophila lebanonensis]XP_030380732.1 protein penguin [Scaptodrosophila lebanonensis]